MPRHLEISEGRSLPFSQGLGAGCSESFPLYRGASLIPPVQKTMLLVSCRRMSARHAHMIVLMGTFKSTTSKHISTDRKLRERFRAMARLNFSACANGFTLIELLVTVAIVAIILSLAAPSFQAMLMNNRLTAQADGVTSALNYARNTALSQGVSVQVCPVGSVNSTTCGASWASGWMVISDPTGTPTLLQSRQIPSTNPVLTSTATSVVFDPRGLSTTLSSFKVCDNRGAAYARSVQVFATGMVQVGTTPGQVAYGVAALTCP